MLGDIAAGPAHRFTLWLELVRKRSGKYRTSGFPNRPPRIDTMVFWLFFPLHFMFYPSLVFCLRRVMLFELINGLMEYL